MLLRNLKNFEIQSVFNLKVDEGDLNLIDKFSKLKEVGVTLQVDEDGIILDDLLDFLITLKLKNINVVLEVDLNDEKNKSVEPSYIYQLSTNAGFSISILPNLNDMDGYREAIKRFTKELLNRPNFEQKVYPISSYMEYLVLEKVLGDKVKNFTPEDAYIVNDFVSKMSVEDSDNFKMDIKNILIENYGGEKNLDILFKTIIMKVTQKSQQMFKEQVEINMKNGG